MNFFGKFFVVTLFAFALAGCASKFRKYDGPQVTRVAVFKEFRRMYLFHGNQVLRAYDIDLGFAPAGDKQVEGDGKTPEGEYLIDRRNPDSKYHLSVGIDYPNLDDVAEAQALGQSAGGDIFIHGKGRLKAFFALIGLGGVSPSQTMRLKKSIRW